LPMDSDEADEENRDPNGKTLLYVFRRGWVYWYLLVHALCSCKQSMQFQSILMAEHVSPLQKTNAQTVTSGQ
jgi:hypothetical protein